MAIPDAVLDQPLDWRDVALWPMLDELQGNILKGHGRDHTLNHFLRFDPARMDAVKAALRRVGFQATSALRQLTEADAYRHYSRPGGTNVYFFLSAGGYQKLGAAPPDGAAFAAGMASRPLGDPPAAEWEKHFHDIDALLIVADDDVTAVGNAAAALTKALAAGGIVVTGIDAGHALRSGPSTNEPKGRGIEHFGYVDGRSQPLLLAEEVTFENVHGGIDVWDPASSPAAMALTRDPGGRTDDSYGSFLVYRKLEQDVRGFKDAEEALADVLGLVEEEDRERAGAMVVGRFEDGTPLVLSESAKDPNPTPNNFDYAEDPDGLKCPLHAHVRKTNPRTPKDAEERSHLMPRRGIPFGDPTRDLKDPAKFPTGGVGLLFMAYNKDLERQFEVTQRFWANSPDFPDGKALGADPVIGQKIADKQKWQAEYGVPGEKKLFRFADFVKMKGGGYFFAPSRSFLKTLA